jgi:hypothetical protein
MHLLCDSYRCIKCIPPKDVEGVYSNTLLGAKLRLFTSDLISSHGPLWRNKSASTRQEWLDLIAKGGDLVTDIAVTGLSSYLADLIPYKRHNRPKYLEVESKRSAIAWYAEKMAVEVPEMMIDYGDSTVTWAEQGMIQEPSEIKGMI